MCFATRALPCPRDKLLLHGMRYVLKQKLLSWGDDFTIRNDRDERVFFVDGKAFSFGDKLSFQDTAGHELAFIRQKLLAWGPTYEIHRGGRLEAVVKKKLFTFLHCPGLDATNNAAERAIRGMVIARKVWGGNRTWEGAHTQQILASVLRTCGQQGKDAFTRCVRLLRAPRTVTLDIVPGAG